MVETYTNQHAPRFTDRDNSVNVAPEVPYPPNAVSAAQTFDRVDIEDVLGR